MNPIHTIGRLACLLTGLAAALAAAVAAAPAAFAATRPYPPPGPPAEVVRFGPAVHTFNGHCPDASSVPGRNALRTGESARQRGPGTGPANACKYSAGPYGRHAQRHFLCLLAQLWLTRFKIGSQDRTPSLPESDNTDSRKLT
jgi:hypothetical protein